MPFKIKLAILKFASDLVDCFQIVSDVQGQLGRFNIEAA
jgi:hypothetical protein